MTDDAIDARARRRGLAFVFALLSASAGAGCAPEPPQTPDQPVDQATRGGAAYAEACAGCHGESGEGSRDGEVVVRPALIGDHALPLEPPAGATVRTARFRTAKDVFDFIKSDMPPIAPGSLEDDDIWAIDAYLMKSRGKLGATPRLDAAHATAIVLR